MAAERIPDDAIIQGPYKEFRRITLAALLGTNAVWLVAFVLALYGSRALGLVWVTTPARLAVPFRESGLRYCAYGEYRSCLDQLAIAGKLDKTNDDRSDVRAAREHANEAWSARRGR